MARLHLYGSTKMKKQIEDMATIALKNTMSYTCAKQSDVAREIFAEIEKIEKRLRKRQNECDKEAEKAGWDLEMRREYEGLCEGIGICLKLLAELKKKYEVKEDEQMPL